MFPYARGLCMFNTRLHYGRYLKHRNLHGRSSCFSRWARIKSPGRSLLIRQYSYPTLKENKDLSLLIPDIGTWANIVKHRRLRLEGSSLPHTIHDSLKDKELETSLHNKIKQYIEESYLENKSVLPELVRSTLVSDGYEKAALFCEEFFTIEQLVEILPTLYVNKATWRQENYFELIVDVVSSKGVLKESWSADNVAQLISELPRVPIVLGNEHQDSDPSRDLVKSRGNIETNIGVVDFEDHEVLWRPQEIGKLIGTILRHEYELDILVNLMANYTKSLYYSESDIHWNDLLGYVSEVYSDCLSSNKHWIDEDYAWSVRVLNNNLFPFITENFDDYTSKEHIMFLADLISGIVIKYGTSRSETGMIHILLNNLCNGWSDEQHEMLAQLIQKRMDSRSSMRRYLKRIESWISKNEVEAPDLGNTKLAPRFDTVFEKRIELVKPVDLDKRTISEKLKEYSQALKSK